MLSLRTIGPLWLVCERSIFSLKVSTKGAIGEPPAIAYARMHPRKVAGVINFAGDWTGEGCPNAGEINGTSFKRGGTFPDPTLWLYGNDDPFYSLDHSGANFAAFQAAGGKGSFFDFEVPGGNGQPRRHP
jgi:hypothetical protein